MTNSGIGTCKGGNKEEEEEEEAQHKQWFQ